MAKLDVLEARPGAETQTLPAAGERRPWHAVPAEDVLASFQSGPRGLSEAEVARRRDRYGANRLTPPPERTALMRFVAQFNNLFIYLLIAAGAVTALLGEWVDSGVIFGVVLIIAIIGFVQEGRAERALEAVRGMLSPTAQVLRDGRRHEIPAEELVPGDIVLLGAGDRVPADLRLIRTKNLQVEEAALTGESTAVEKRPDPVAEDAELGDRASLAFSGTLVTVGQGTGVVVAVGDATEIGRISGMLSEVETLKTPLTQRLDAFAKVLSVAIIALAAFTFAIGVVVWGQDWGDMFFAAVSIAVAAIPEGLPAIMTITLAVGVQRMAKRNAIIRRLPAVETLGSVTIVCSDKTGTLTKNEMTAKTIRTADADIEVEGVGYEPHGGFLIDDQAVNLEDYPTAFEMVRAAMLCNDAALHREGDRWQPEGDPTEAALIVLARKAGFEPEREHEERPRVDVIPFASERRYMATLNHDHHGHRFVYVKGAPERVLEMCTGEQRGGEVAALDAEAWRRRVDEVADRGQRLLAVARKDVTADTPELREEDAERDLVLLGLFGLIDPPREEAIRAVGVCQSAGIRVKMITGDHALTARAVARELGLANPAAALTGRELEGIADDELRRHAVGVDVFARASPEHKLRLVQALQAERQVTAMTGDGVNDAPALKRADVGIAMGRKGTEAAKEAAEMVLADDNFASIENAVEEGRTVYDNLKKAILFILPTNGAQALVIVVAILLGLMLPVTPVQILWVNMITAVTLGLAFAFERAERDIMLRPPRPADEPLLTGFILWRIGFVGLLLVLGVGLLFLYEQDRPETSVEFARTVAVNTLVMGQIFYLLSARFFHEPAYTREGLFGSRAVLIAIGVCVVLQLLFTYAPFMNLLFGTAPLDAEAWARCVGVGLAVFVLVELEKAVFRTWLRPRPEPAGATAA
jgi:magnesium-transporting ATPase (P-type)